MLNRELAEWPCAVIVLSGGSSSPGKTSRWIGTSSTTRSKLDEQPVLDMLFNALNDAESDGSRVKYLRRPIDYTFKPKKTKVRALQGLDRTRASSEETLDDAPPRVVSAADGGTPVAGPKIAESFAGYVPEGILKRDWMCKHREMLPSVIALVCEFDVDFSHNKWVAREKEITHDMEQVRENLNGRDDVVRMVLVLIQNRDYPRMMEVPKKEQLARDRIDGLRRTLEMEAKNIMLVYTNDLQNGPTDALVKIKDRLTELSMEYYRMEGKRIRGYQKHISKSLPGGLALSARLNFKVGQFYEVRKLANKALRHYEEAFNTILDLVNRKLREGANVPYCQHEIKCAAEYIHYRLLVLHATAGHVHSFLGQFKKYVKGVGQLKGPENLAFQHHEWMCRQYFMFGESLTELRPGLALAELSTLDRLRMEPMYVNEVAAFHAVMRRKIAEKLGVYGGSLQAAADQARRHRELDHEMERNKVSVRPSIYVGAPPKISCKGENTLSAHDVERIQLQAIREEEGKCNQSAEALTLLNSACIMVAQHHRSHQERLTNHQLRSDLCRRESILLARIGEERLKMGQYLKALDDLQPAIHILHKEQWWSLLVPVLRNAIACAEAIDGERDANMTFYDVTQRRSFIRFAMLLISPRARQLQNEEERVHVESLLQRWIQAPIKEMDEDVDENAGEDIEPHRKASGVVISKEIVFSADELSTPSLVDWMAQFEKKSVRVGASVTLRLRIETHFPTNSIQFDRLAVVFNHEHYEIIVAHNPHLRSESMISLGISPDDSNSRLEANLSSLQSSEFLITFPISPQTKLDSLRVTRIAVRIANPSTESDTRIAGVVLWSSAPRLRSSVAQLLEMPQSLNLSKHDLERAKVPRDCVRVRSIEPNATLQLSERRIPLQGEPHPIYVEINSKEDFMRDLHLVIKASPPSCSIKIEHGDSEWKFPGLPPKSSKTLVARCMAAPTEPTLLLEATLEYDMEGAASRIQISESIRIKHLLPFVAKLSIFGDSPFRQNPDRLVIGKPFAVQVGIECNPSLPKETRLAIEGIYLEPEEESIVLRSFSKVEANLGPGERASTVFQLTPNQCLEQAMLGKLRIDWNRGNMEKSSTSLNLCKISVYDPPFTFALSTSPQPFGKVGQVTRVNIVIQNNTAALQRLSIQVDPQGQAHATHMRFFLIGPSSKSIALAPRHKASIVWRVVALCPGTHRLPTFVIESHRHHTKFYLPTPDQSTLYVRQ